MIFFFFSSSVVCFYPIFRILFRFAFFVFVNTFALIFFFLFKFKIRWLHTHHLIRTDKIYMYKIQYFFLIKFTLLPFHVHFRYLSCVHRIRYLCITVINYSHVHYKFSFKNWKSGIVCCRKQKPPKTKHTFTCDGRHPFCFFFLIRTEKNRNIVYRNSVVLLFQSEHTWFETIKYSICWVRHCLAHDMDEIE